MLTPRYHSLLFERLLREVQQPGLPFEKPTRESRGEVQVSAFWDDVRKELQFDESFLEYNWPDEYPEVSLGGLGKYLSQGDRRNPFEPDRCVSGFDTGSWPSGLSVRKRIGLQVERVLRG